MQIHALGALIKTNTWTCTIDARSRSRRSQDDIGVVAKLETLYILRWISACYMYVYKTNCIVEPAIYLN
ncbi:hypothetical protein QE152_g18146 [Popillia japonica]|uniref:Uncharacterized protein n=1 Tax=Popillia japonica TaxID=7064 RepID=A0AAW1L453_POPJA